MYLGTFLTGQAVTFKVRWLPIEGEAPITGSTLILTAPSGIVTEIEGTPTEVANEWTARYTCNEAGEWEVDWETTPPGGVSNDSAYFDLV